MQTVSVPAGAESTPLSADAVLPLLVSDLGKAESGIGFIYGALDRIVEWAHLRDAFVVIEDPVVGRQVFRAGRKAPQPLGNGLDPFVVPSGLYCDPELPAGPVRDAIPSLCHVALQLDLSRHDASHDPLTGLYNRRSFDAMLQQSAVRSARYGWRFVFALFDVDRFKLLNDQFGHDAGDHILRTVGAELRSSLRGGDAAARIGGDEFALLLHNGDAHVLHLLIDRVQSAVGKAVGVEVGFSAGAASAPDDSSDPAVLYRLADQQLYQSKRGRD